MSAVPVVEIQSGRRGTPPIDSTIYHDVIKDGRFIIGAQTLAEAMDRKEALEANSWTHLDCYKRGHPDPVEWIEFVRSKDWTFQNAAIEYLDDGRVFFGGNIVEYSAAFRYLILDLDLAAKVASLAPEVPVERD